MNKAVRKLLGASVLAGTILTVAVSAEARDLRAAPSLPQSHPAYSILYGKFAEFLPEETNGELNITILGPEVVDAKGMKAALDSGLTEVGNLLPAYSPSDLPNFASAGDLALLGNDSQAIAAAVSEFIAFCEDCQKELSAAGLVFFGAAATDGYVLLTTKPVKSLDDLKGMRLRSGGAPFSRWAESVGATPVGLPLADTFESMSQGVIDGSMTSITDLISMRLIDLTKYITDVRIGTYSTTSDFTVRKDVWNSFTPEQKRGFAKAAARANATYVQEGYLDRSASAREAAIEAGIEILEPEQDLLDQISAFKTADVATATQVATEKYQVANAGEKFARYQELLEKWEKIVADLDGDPVRIGEARFNEIWAKVDLDTYGK